MGKKSYFNRLKSVVILNEYVFKYYKALSSAKKYGKLVAAVSPSLFGAFDIYGHMFPLVNLRGTSTAIDYYKLLLYELQERVRKGIGVIVNKRRRLLWDYLPIYHKMNFFLNFCPKKMPLL